MNQPYPQADPDPAPGVEDHPVSEAEAYSGAQSDTVPESRLEPAPGPSAAPTSPSPAPAGALAATARAAAPPLPAAPMADALPQVYAHLARLAAAGEHEVAELAAIRSGLTRVYSLVAALAEHLTDVAGLRPVDARLADMVARIEASDERLNAVLDAVTKLGRTQFKSNTLAEAQEQRVGAALATLQTLATRRDESASGEAAEWEAALARARADGRGEMAAGLLPVIDGLEAALDSGRARIERQRLTATAVVRPPAPPALPAPPAPPAPSGWVARLRSAAAGRPPPRPIAVPVPTVPAPAPAVPIEAVEAWLAGLDLIRARCLDLLAAEGIAPIPALGQRFDAHLHVAVATETRADAAPGTVVTVGRQGYRQGERVLRYAEVTVAQAVARPAPTSAGEVVESIPRAPSEFVAEGIEPSPTAPFESTLPSESVRET